MHYASLSRRLLGVGELLLAAGEGFAPLAEDHRLLYTRFNLIVKAQSARLFGLLVLNANQRDFAELLALARAGLARHGRKHYKFLMNKISEGKLRAFPEIEMYVALACPFASLIEAREFKVPIVSVQELLIALDVESWARVSLFDRRLTPDAWPAPPPARELAALRADGELVAADYFQNAEFYAARGYKGLEYRVGTQPTRATLGQVGVPQGYAAIAPPG